MVVVDGDAQALAVGFNEAGAARPRKFHGPAFSGHRGWSFNEAGAARPRKYLEGVIRLIEGKGWLQ